MDVKRIREKFIRLGRFINETGQDNHDRVNKKDSNGKKNHRIKFDRFHCDSKLGVTFASSDVHDGPRTDISFVLLKMNQSFVHIGPRNATKNYPQGWHFSILFMTSKIPNIYQNISFGRT